MVSHAPARDWLADNTGNRLRTHAAGHLDNEAARLAHRWGTATAADLLGEIRDELSAVAARAALTAEALDARTVRSSDRETIDAALRGLLAAVEGSYADLTRALGGAPHREPAHVERTRTPPKRMTPKPHPSPQRDRAAALIRDQLANGPVSAATVLDAADRAGVPRATFYAAAAQIGVERERGPGTDGRMTWRLPDDEPEPAPAVEAEPVEVAASMIADALADGQWHPAGGVLAAIVGAGIDREAAWAAAEQLGVERERHDGRATWRLPAGTLAKAAA